MTPLELRRLMSALRAIEKNLSDIKQHLQSIAINTQSYDKNDKPYPTVPPRVIAELSFPVAISEKYEADHRRPWRTRAIKGFKFILEVGAIGVAVWLAVLNMGVLNEIRRQTPHIADSADAAKKSAAAVQDQVGMEKRTAENRDEAVCTTQGDIAVGESVFHTYISNSGNVSARNVTGHVDISLNKLPANNQTRLLGSFDVQPQDISSHHDLRNFLTVALSAADWDALVDTRESIVETSRIQYENGFNRMVSAPRCFAIFWVPSPDDPMNRAHGRAIDCDQLPVQLAAERARKR
jgi:hypothetical protein